MPTALIAFIIPLAALVVVILVARSVLLFSRDDPTIWESEIRRFEAQDWRSGRPSCIVVFTGSSSIRYWTTLPANMAPIPALNRGFGGSQVHQVAYYANRVVVHAGGQLAHPRLLRLRRPAALHRHRAGDARRARPTAA